MWCHWVQTVGCSAQGRPYRKSLSAKPWGVFINFLQSHRNRWSLSWHFLVWLTGSAVSSELSWSRIQVIDWTLVNFSLGSTRGSTELSLTLQTITCTPKSLSACHHHQNLEDWSSLRAILAFLALHEAKNPQSERDFAWSCSWMNGSLIGYMRFCVENRIVRGEQFIALDFYHLHLPRVCSPSIRFISVVVVSYLRIICVYIFSLLWDFKIGVMP